MAVKKKQTNQNNKNVLISYDMWYKQQSATIVQSWSKPRLCVEWTWVDKKLVMRQWSYTSCVLTSDIASTPVPPTIVSADSWNIITVWTDWWAFLDIAWLELSLDTSLVYSEPNTTDWWLTYTNVDWVSNFIKLSHIETITPVANVATTITHWLNSTRVQVVAYDVTTWEQVDIEVSWRTATTIDVTSTTTDDIEIVIKK